MAAWAGAVMHNSFAGWLRVFLEYTIPAFVVITAMVVIYSISKYSRRKLGVTREKKPANDKDSVEI